MSAPLLTLLVLAAGAAGAAPQGVEDGAPVVRIEIIGQRRTSERTIRRALRLAPGDPYRADQAAVLAQRLMNTRLFRSASVEAVPDEGGDRPGVALRVRVAERVALVPVPVVAASRGVFTAGLTILDSNLFGGGQQLVVGGLGSNRGANGFAFYRDPGVAGSRWLLALEAQAQDVRRERFERRTRVEAFRDRRLDLGAGSGLQLDERWAVRAGWFEAHEESLPTPGVTPPPRAGTIHGPSAELELTADRYRLYYADGLSGRARLRQGVRLAGGDREVRQASALLTWAAAGPRDHAVSVTVAADDVHGDPFLDALRLGGRPGSRGFVSQGLWAERAATAALEYQVPVWKPRWGVVTLAGFTDAGVVRWRSHTTRYLAPGAGLRLYLRNVAIPVLGFDFAWATGMPGPAPSVLLGFRG